VPPGRSTDRLFSRHCDSHVMTPTRWSKIFDRVSFGYNSVSSTHANVTGALVNRAPEPESQNPGGKKSVWQIYSGCMHIFRLCFLFRDGTLLIPSTQRYRISPIYSINRTTLRPPQVLDAMNSHQSFIGVGHRPARLFSFTVHLIRYGAVGRWRARKHPIL
jgi:hypothetical protein